MYHQHENKSHYLIMIEGGYRHMLKTAVIPEHILEQHHSLKFQPGIIHLKIQKKLHFTNKIPTI